VNVVGFLRGTERPDRYFVVTAHYDHLGVRNGNVFNGADDNASGTAGILALAQYFKDHPPRHSMLFVAFDSEEGGLRGARAFVADPPVARESIIMNINLDMIGRNERNELFAAGTYHTPQFVPLIEAVAAQSPLKLRTGHDRPGLPAGDDWTNSSDHGPFHAAGIPFLYFGEEDHADYHKVTDDFERIQPEFHARAVETILETLLRLDRDIDSILRRRSGMRP
jgi:Zn-dependent M28 family amino/carboxypeptidase